MELQATSDCGEAEGAKQVPGSSCSFTCLYAQAPATLTCLRASSLTRWGSVEARRERSNEGKQRRATVGHEARSERSSEGKERRDHTR